jgi:hypothetical protein
VAEQRTGGGELSYLRLWGLQSDRQFQTMEEVMRGQQEAGLHTRYVVGEDLDDISLIWIPAAGTEWAADLKDEDNPVDELDERRDEFRPLCGIRFGAPRAGQELDEMTIFSPDTDDFKQLGRYSRRSGRRPSCCRRGQRKRMPAPGRNGDEAGGGDSAGLWRYRHRRRASSVSRVAHPPPPGCPSRSTILGVW